MTVNTIPFKQYEIEEENSNMVLEDVWEKQEEFILNTKRQPVLEAIISKLLEATEIVCISSNSKLPKEILHEIPKLAQKGVRVYLILNTYEDTYESFVSNNAIIRINPAVSGLMVLIDPKVGSSNNRGYLFSSAAFNLNDKGMGWYTSLSGEQLKEAFHYYTWKFWNATEEIRGNNPTNPLKAQAPFDIYPLIEPECFYYNNWERRYLKDKVMEVVRSANYDVKIGLSSFEEYEEIFPVLNEKAQNGIKIYIYTGLNVNHKFMKLFNESNNIKFYSLTELDNYFVFVDKIKGLFLSGSIYNQSEMGIVLSSKVTQDFYEQLKNLKMQAWTFHNNVLLGQIKGEKIIFEKYDNKMDAVQLKNSEIVEHGTFTVGNLREYFSGSFRPTITKKNILSKSIIHRWKVNPILLDEKSKKDPLYDQWEKEINKITNYLEKVLSYANEVNLEKKVILNSFIGKLFQKEDNVNIGKLISSLENALKDIELKKYKWENFKDLLCEVNSYSQKILEQQLELFEKQEYYQKKEEWEKEKEVLDKELHNIQKNIMNIEGERDLIKLEMSKKSPEFEQEAIEIETQLKENNELLQIYEMEYETVIHIKRTEDKILELCNFLDSEIKRFNKLKNKEKKDFFNRKIKPQLEKEMILIQKKSILDEILNASKITDSKQNMQFIMKELGTRKELRVEMSTGELEIISGYDILISKKESLEQEREILMNKNKNNNVDNIKKLNIFNRELKIEEEKLTLLNKRIEAKGNEFKFVRQKKETGLPFEEYVFNLPKETLPIVGELYRIGKKRQLTIVSEEQLDQGEIEAERLFADLVLNN